MTNSDTERKAQRIVEELLDGLRQHQATPHECRRLLDEEAGRHDLERAVADTALVGDDLWLVGVGNPLGLHSIAHAEQARDGEPPDVGVEKAGSVSESRDGEREIDAERGLADAALSAGHRDDTGLRTDHGGGCRLPGSETNLPHQL